ncbi:MAG TPA: hypothetical protein VJG90_00955 [Candidatus Nanoarchaeia archaeon]|nr:hypothetical protein [Candidatus Nanoarchaeia archaeon]
MKKKSKGKKLEKEPSYLNTKPMEEMQWVFEMLGWDKNERTHRNR